MILAPVVVDRKGEQLELFDELRAQGFVRVRVDGKVHEIDAVPQARQDHEAHDRGRDRPAARCSADMQAAPGRIVRDGAAPRRRPRARRRDGHRATEHLFSAKFACPICNYSLPELEPRLFSFNNPMGACPRCDGLGSISFFDPKRVVAFPHLSLASRRDQGLGPAQPVLLPDAAEPRQALRLRRRDAVRRSCPSARSRSILYGSRRREDSVHVPVRARQADGARARVRGHHPQPRAALPRDRFGGGARGAREVPEHRSPAPSATARGCGARRAT